MGLSSISKRKGEAAAAADSTDEVQQARTRARRRLIGAVVLLGIGIVGFPLVFETQPRPIPVDIPIEIPRRERAAPLPLPPASETADAKSPTLPQRASGAASDDIVTEMRDDPAPHAAPGRPDNRPGASVLKPTPSVPPKPAGEPEVAAAVEAARARALLEGAAPAASSAARFVVQVGAFADAGAAQDTRLKMEKLGLKTYTQVASTAAGGRVRVRIGPFTTRDEADRALARARTAGLSGVVIGL